MATGSFAWAFLLIWGNGCLTLSGREQSWNFLYWLSQLWVWAVSEQAKVLANQLPSSHFPLQVLSPSSESWGRQSPTSHYRCTWLRLSYLGVPTQISETQAIQTSSGGWNSHNQVWDIGGSSTSRNQMGPAAWLVVLQSPSAPPHLLILILYGRGDVFLIMSLFTGDFFSEFDDKRHWLLKIRIHIYIALSICQATF